MKPIYLDYAAATPLDMRVLAIMQPYFAEQFYNPSSPYLAGKRVRAAIEDARGRVAHWLGAKPTEVIFTAGATESINGAIHGIMRQFAGAKVITCSTEHEAVLASVKSHNHHIVPVSKQGTVDIAALSAAIDDETVLISIGYANNEIGTIQPLKEVTELVGYIRGERKQAGNELPLYVHTDASQAASYLDLHAARLQVDLMTLNGGKLYGPKQTGVLFVKTGTNLAPLITGGGQEQGVRSGTENVAGIVGLAAALDIAQTDRKEAIAKLSALRDELQRRLQQAFPGMVVNGNQKRRLPNNLHVSWPGIDGERLLMMLDERGIQVATGSACAANKQTASHVLIALGLDETHIQGSLRISLGSPTTAQEVEMAATSIIECVSSIEGL